VKTLKTLWTRGYKERRDIERLLTRADVDSSEGEWNVAVGIHGWSGCFETNDSRWKRLEDEIRKTGHSSSVRDHVLYDDAEIAAADLLILQPLEWKGQSGPDFGNEYDLTDACPRCLMGARVLAPFRVEDARDLPRKRLTTATENAEILVQGVLALALQTIPGHEQWLLPVEEHKSGRPTPWRAIGPRSTLPRAHPSTRGLIQDRTPGPNKLWACDVCHRDCYTTTSDFELVYSRREVEIACAQWLDTESGLPNVSCTWEGFGNGRRLEWEKNHVAMQYVVVSQRIARIFLESAPKPKQQWMQLVRPARLVE
jgi:hypothetical protein